MAEKYYQRFLNAAITVLDKTLKMNYTQITSNEEAFLEARNDGRSAGF